jgi:hypothetical protein
VPRIEANALFPCDGGGSDGQSGNRRDDDGGSAPQVALAVQGRAADIAEWQRLLLRVRGRADLSFFFLAYDGGGGGDGAVLLADSICGGDGGACWAPAAARTGTWTEGRNLVAARVLAAEVERGSRFRYWLFCDSDVRLDRCAKCYGEQRPMPLDAEDDLAAAQWRCCFAPVLDILLSRTFEPATLTWKILGPNPPAAILGEVDAAASDAPGSVTVFPLRRYNCADARFQAIHRDAAPALLPYFTDLDAKSWWSSQGIQHILTVGCLDGANFELFVPLIENKTEHAPYPRGRTKDHIDAEIQVVNASLGAALWPWPLPLVGMTSLARFPSCPHALGTTQPFVAVNITAVAASSVGVANPGWNGGGGGGGADSWRLTPAFAACAAAMRARNCRLQANHQ